MFSEGGMSTCDVLSVLIVLHPSARVCVQQCVTCQCAVAAILARIASSLGRALSIARVGSTTKRSPTSRTLCVDSCVPLELLLEFTGPRLVHDSIRDTGMVARL